MHVTTSQYEITFAQSKRFPSERNLPVRGTKIDWNKQHFDLR